MVLLKCDVSLLFKIFFDCMLIYNRWWRMSLKMKLLLLCFGFLFWICWFFFKFWIRDWLIFLVIFLSCLRLMLKELWIFIGYLLGRLIMLYSILVWLDSMSIILGWRFLSWSMFLLILGVSLRSIWRILILRFIGGSIWLSLRLKSYLRVGY